jgi:hypothetical protein
VVWLVIQRMLSACGGVKPEAQFSLEDLFSFL